MGFRRSAGGATVGPRASAEVRPTDWLELRASYGEGYRYPHDEGGHAMGETYLPEQLEGRRYYHPADVGLESRIRERLDGLRRKGPGEPNT